ncbi:MAG: hypothetical protein Q8O19_07805 [Rectinemataceae bacterium]|nr:hypothetical protein [Rectinemataceae bacterium]
MNDTNFSQVMEALELNELPPEEQEALLLDLNSLIFRGSMVRLIERMDEKTRDDFARLVEGGVDEKGVETFLRERVPDADSAVAETVQEISDDILAVTGTK